MKKKKQLFLFMTFVLLCLPVFAQESFETGDFSANNWQNGGNADWTIVTSNPQDGTYCAKSGTVTHYENSELFLTLNVTRLDTLSFYWRVSSEYNYDFLIFSIDGGVLAQISGDTNWSLFEVPIPPGEHTVSWKYEKDRNTDGGDDAGYIDNISFPEMEVQSADDLRLTGVDFPARIFEPSESYQFNFHVENTGTNDASGYTIGLYKSDDTLLHSFDVPSPLVAGADVINLLTWNTPDQMTSEYTEVYGKITYQNDENDSNNSIDHVDVKFVDTSEVDLVIDNNASLQYNQIPFDLTSNMSVYQTIVSSNQIIGFTGNLYELCFYNNFIYDVENVPVKIYMGETEGEDLTNGWIQLYDQQLVYEGSIDFMRGNHLVNIALNTPYSQRLGNLVVTVIRSYTPEAYSQNNKFYCNTMPQYEDQTRLLYSSTDIDLSQGLTGGIIMDMYADFAIFASPFTGGDLDGYVYDENDNPIEGASVNVVGTNSERLAFTNEAGYYILRNIPEGTHDITYWAEGYEEYTEQGVQVTLGQLASVNINLGLVGNDDVEDVRYATAIIGNYPNPFNPETNISFSLSESSNAELIIYNVKGQKVVKLVDKFLNDGKHTFTWSGKDSSNNDVSTGVYFYRLRANGRTASGKMLLMK